MVVGTEDYTEQAIAAGSINDTTGWRAYKLGVVTNLSNPKSARVLRRGFRAVYSPRYVAHVDRCSGGNPLGDVCDMVSTFALIVRAASRWIAHHSAAIDIVSGLIFAVLGLVMTVEGVIELFG